VINLARLASSGGDAHRGGQDHEGHAFKAKTCFLFSSILLPPLLQQDRNRMAILELEKIPRDAIRSSSTRPSCASRPQLRRRLIDQWPRLDALLAKYRTALADASGTAADRRISSARCSRSPTCCSTTSPTTIYRGGRRLGAADTLAEKSMELADEEEAVNYPRLDLLKGRGGDEPEPVSAYPRPRCSPTATRRAIGSRLRAADRPSEEGRARQVIGHDKPKGDAPGRALPRDRQQPHAACRDLRADALEGGRLDASVQAASTARRARQKVRFAGARKPIWSTLIPLPAILD
jgi:hypothetical protein